MIYGYVLCTAADDRRKIDNEVKQLVQLGAKSENICVEFSDESAKIGQKLIHILNSIKDGDTLISSSPGRLVKNSLQMHELVKLIRRLKARLVFGSTILDFSGRPDSEIEGMLAMAEVFKELEMEHRSTIKNAGTASGSKNKRNRVGRPPLSAESVPGIFHRYYPKYLSREINITELSRLCNISRTMIYRYIDVVGSN
jgi:hypothetical protein